MMLPGYQTEPRSYEEHKRRILEGLSEAQRAWERDTGSRLLVSHRPPYFSYIRDLPARLGRPAA